LTFAHLTCDSPICNGKTVFCCWIWSSRVFRGRIVAGTNSESERNACADTGARFNIDAYAYANTNSDSDNYAWRFGYGVCAVDFGHVAEHRTFAVGNADRRPSRCTR